MHTGRHRAVRHWWRLAAVVAVVMVVVTAAIQIAGNDTPGPGAASEAALPLWTGAPWSLATPPVSIAPSIPSAPATIRSGPATAVPAVPTTVPSRSRAVTKKPFTPAVTVNATDVPASVDLSDEGRQDWMHWGLNDATSVNRRRGGDILEDLGGTARSRYDNNPHRYEWTGGSPTEAVTGTPTGVYSCGTGATFVLRAPAGPAIRTLRVYAGVWLAAGQLTVTVPGADTTRTLENRNGISTNRFEIRYRAAAGTQLTVVWTATASYHPTCGNINLQAATIG